MKEKLDPKKRKSGKQPTDHKPETLRIRKVMGQLESVEKMIISGRFYIQIMQQLQAAISALSSLKVELLKSHLSECLAESAQTKNYSRLTDQVVEIVRIQMRR